jgi:hypothetical protein
LYGEDKIPPPAGVIPVTIAILLSLSHIFIAKQKFYAIFYVYNYNFTRENAMNSQTAIDEYAHALRLGQKEYRELLMAGKEPHPAVLDDILPGFSTESVFSVGLVDIPTERIVAPKPPAVLLPSPPPSGPCWMPNRNSA